MADRIEDGYKLLVDTRRHGQWKYGGGYVKAEGGFLDYWRLEDSFSGACDGRSN